MATSVKVALDGAGYNDTKPLEATGFLVQFGVGYPPAPVSATVKLNFAEGIDLLNQLVAAAKLHHESVRTRLAETGQLAAMAVAVASAEDVI